MHVLKADVSDGFYRIGLRLTGAPKLGLIFPSKLEDNELVVIPLTLPMGWKNSPPIFFTATVTVADLTDSVLRYIAPSLRHNLDDMTESIVIETPPTIHLALSGLTRGPYFS